MVCFLCYPSSTLDFLLNFIKLRITPETFQGCIRIFGLSGVYTHPDISTGPFWFLLGLESED